MLANKNSKYMASYQIVYLIVTTIFFTSWYEISWNTWRQINLAAKLLDRYHWNALVECNYSGICSSKPKAF